MSESSIFKISNLSHPDPLVVIVGPTAVGKTEISLQLAARLGGEVVSADSRLFYRGMDIGTAKPSPAEQARAPHHLIDIAEPDDIRSLSDFQQMARQVIADIHTRGRLPLLVGGTGQYVHALLESWEIPPQTADPAMRAALERWAAEIGPHALHRRLAVLDPEAARQIDARNVRRTVRALEVTLRTGRRFSAQRQRGGSPYSLLIVGLNRPRPELYRRIDERIEAMFAGGFVDEVRGLLAHGYAASLPTMSAIGYREVAAYLRGEMTQDEAITQMKRFTRRFVRRQANWFSAGNSNIHWFEAGPDTANQIEALIRSGEGWVAQGEEVGFSS